MSFNALANVECVKILDDTSRTRQSSCRVELNARRTMTVPGTTSGEGATMNSVNCIIFTRLSENPCSNFQGIMLTILDAHTAHACRHDCMQETQAPGHNMAYVRGGGHKNYFNAVLFSYILLGKNPQRQRQSVSQ